MHATRTHAKFSHDLVQCGSHSPCSCWPHMPLMRAADTAFTFRLQGRQAGVRWWRSMLVRRLQLSNARHEQVIS